MFKRTCFISLALFTVFALCFAAQSTAKKEAKKTPPLPMLKHLEKLIPQSKFYRFEKDDEGWVCGSVYETIGGFGLSLTHNTDPKYCYNNSKGSLKLDCDFTKELQSYAVASIKLPEPQNLYYHVITAKVYIPDALATTTNPVTLEIRTGINKENIALHMYAVEAVKPGWYDLVYDLTDPTEDYHNKVDEISIAIYSKDGNKDAYKGPVYIDDVAW